LAKLKSQYTVEQLGVLSDVLDLFTELADPSLYGVESKDAYNKNLTTCGEVLFNEAKAGQQNSSPADSIQRHIQSLIQTHHEEIQEGLADALVKPPEEGFGHVFTDPKDGN
jgi:hypothetical protein